MHLLLRLENPGTLPPVFVHFVEEGNIWTYSILVVAVILGSWFADTPSERRWFDEKSQYKAVVWIPSGTFQ